MRSLALALGATMLAAAVPAQAQDEQARARRVYQIFKDTCLECHGDSAKGGLDLRTGASLRIGGQSGEVVVPHEPAKSLLYQLVTHSDDPPMPRK
jgi:mono/diheme cytochrome c family protein